MKKSRLVLLGIVAAFVCGAVAFFSMGPPRRHRAGFTGEQRPSYEARDASVTTAPQAEVMASAKVDTVAWNRFRGPNGTGISTDDKIPTEWSDTQNLRWKCKLPGAGSSSPVLTEKFVFLTSYSGYGLGRHGVGESGVGKRIEFDSLR